MRTKLYLLLVIPLFMFFSNLSILHANPIKSERAESVTQPSNSALSLGKISINIADAEMLATHLIGVGLKKAKAVVEYRQKYGPFTSPSQLAEVPGFGPVLVKQNLARLKL